MYLRYFALESALKSELPSDQTIPLLFHWTLVTVWVTFVGSAMVILVNSKENSSSQVCCSLNSFEGAQLMLIGYS